MSTTVSTSRPPPAPRRSRSAPLEHHLGQEIAEAAGREALHEEIRLSTELYVEGIAVRPEDRFPFRVGTKVNDQRQLMFDMNRRRQKEVLLPTELFLPRGSADRGWFGQADLSERGVPPPGEAAGRQGRRAPSRLAARRHDAEEGRNGSAGGAGAAAPEHRAPA